ncbi:hypothetical protein COEREDRAFT_10345 [Coemansia reversa NRRL 1564]|uniref:Dynactin subunit 4 n=1 Tax=Coemansia reversa (strain ATCC 12441 / NRRL 1564) TaxID=763665 RepID=A0A2G5B636_COERN|nr:hypothetical protein COEREDRAFT_10345 [Coemansia reversa NRRL 1564]|eukprot:PIA14452.1 hypothetical protein COEREDRAFT_10345 [Coemansia reversa NRRL 1564]
MDKANASVLYYCPCTGCMRTSEAPNAPSEVDAEQRPLLSTRGSAVQSGLAVMRLWPIERLYYCDDCSEVRCPRCVVEEPAGYHCPNCLFDVPTASVRSEKNRCARNCFQCPLCTHVLSVVEHDGLGRDGESAGFLLSCAVCFWDSRAIDWVFEKATGISAQVERLKAAEASSKEYANLLDYWRSVQRAASHRPATRLSAAASSAAFKHRLAGSGTHVSAATTVDAVPPYKAACYENDDHERVAQQMALDDARSLPFSADQYNRSGEPQRVRLHMKLSRRCRICHHILIKPESKAQATRFKIQLIAANFLPSVTVPTALASPRSRVSVLDPIPAFPLRVGSTVPCVIRLANPLYTEMDVTVAATSDDDVTVDVLASQFTLPPFAELWEYDEEEDDESTAAARSDDSRRGIVHRHGNRVAIRLDLTPHTQVDSLTIPLHIICSHVDDMPDIDTEDTASSSRRIVTNSFWAYISLGTMHQASK